MSLRSLKTSFDQALEVACLSTPKHPESRDLFKAIQKIILEVDKDGQTKAALGLEPDYHNRQHFADTCLALAFFLREIEHFSEYQKLLLMLTMLVHDFGHKGIANLNPNASQEMETVELLRSSILRNLSNEDLNFVTNLILGTSPKNLDSINMRHLNDPNNPHYFMQSLINDADIAASFIDELTPNLTRKILIESGNQNPSAEDVSRGIQFFKVNFQITTDIAKRCLNQ